MNRNLSSSQIRIEKNINLKSWLFGALAAFILSFIAINFLPKDSFLRISSLIALTAIALVPAKKYSILYFLLILVVRPVMHNFLYNGLIQKKIFLQLYRVKKSKTRGRLEGMGLTSVNKL